MEQKAAGELVKRYMERTPGMTQIVLAHELTVELGRRVDQPTVSKHLRGSGWTFELGPAYAKILRIPAEEMAAAFGYQMGEGPRAVTLADIVKTDPTLSAEAKKHLLNQYGLLQLATKEERRGRPVLPESKSKSRRSG